MRSSGKILRLLDKSHRHKALALLGLMLIGMVLETIGVGLVVPAVGLMTTQDLDVQYPETQDWIEFLGHPTQMQLVIGGMLILVAIYGIKTIFLAFLAWWQAKFVFGLHANLSQRLFANYLRQPYIFHLEHNSAQLLRNVVTEVNLFTNATQSFMTLLAEGLVLMGIITLLFIVEPWGAVFVGGTLGISVGVFYHMIRLRILRWGKRRQHHEGLRIQHVQQGLGGIKDIKVLGREPDFLEQYRLHNYGNAEVLQRQNVLLQLPRLWLELIAVTGLVAVVLAMIGQEKPLDSLLPTLAMFAAAAFRLMPSINRGIGAVQSVRFALPVIHTLYRELIELKVPAVTMNNQKLQLKNQLVLDNVTFHYPNTQEATLKNISLVIPYGVSMGFIGGSGAGKSTLVDIILGLLSPTSGKVTVDQIDIQSNLRSWQDQIGYVPQTIFLTDDTLRRNIAFGLSDDQIDDGAVQRAIRSAQLEEFVETLPQGIKTIVGERGVRLSGGQRQRIGIARALYRDPPVLVLDEATSSLDTATEQGVVEAIKAMRGEKTIIIIAHRLSTIAHCDCLIRLEQGQVQVVPDFVCPDILPIQDYVQDRKMYAQ